MIDKLLDYESRGLIKSQKHPFADLIIWNYTPEVQFNPELWDDITLMCRGLITNSKGDIIERPFKKFFNYGELGLMKPVDADCVIQDKLDGSLGIMYWLQGRPYIASRGSFTSDQAREGSQMVGDAWFDYERTQRNMFPRRCEIFDDPGQYTHLFEIIYPENRIVVDYGEKRDLIYLCSIDKMTGETRFFSPTYFEQAKSYSPTVFNNIMANQPLAHEQEGFIVLYPDGERLKFKFDDYKRVHYIMSELSDVRIWEWCKAGEHFATMLDNIPDELYSQIKNFVEKLDNKYTYLHMMSRNIYKRARAFETRKEQAEYIFEQLIKYNLEKKLSGVIFNLLDGKDIDVRLWDLVKPPSGRTFLDANSNNTQRSPWLR